MYFMGTCRFSGMCTFEVKEKEIVVLVGANGAGKTTTIRTISALLNSAEGGYRVQRPADRPPPRQQDHRTWHRPRSRGTETLPGNDGGGKPDYGIPLRQGQEPTLRDHGAGVFPLSPPSGAQEADGGNPLRRRTADAGHRPRLDVRPQLMMLDEPSLGLAPLLVQEVFNLVKRINEQGVTVLLVEQNVRLTLAMCDRAYVLENGRIVLEGAGKKLLENEQVKKAFLGI